MSTKTLNYDKFHPLYQMVAHKLFDLSKPFQINPLGHKLKQFKNAVGIFDHNKKQIVWHLTNGTKVIGQVPTLMVWQNDKKTDKANVGKMIDLIDAML